VRPAVEETQAKHAREVYGDCSGSSNLIIDT
jgi:hypothetical protein